MTAEVDVPAVGRVKKQWVIASGALVAGIVGVAWWRRRQTAAAAAAVPVVDPTTGTNSRNPTYSNPNPVVSPDSTAQLPPANDQEWTQRVMAALNWFEPGFLGDVLGKYLGRQPLTVEEAAVVRVAWAVSGKPPSNTQIVLATTGSTPGTTPPPDTSVKPPSPPTGMRAVVWGTNYIYFDWAPTPGATSYVVIEPNGSERKTAGPSAMFGGAMGGDLKGSYTLKVAAVNSAGQSAFSTYGPVALTGGTH